MGFFWQKCLMFEWKEYRGVIFNDTEEWWKIWRKTDLWFGKWHEKFGKFSPEHSKVSKLGLWWDPFIQSRKCMSLKFTEELCIMTMKNDAKIEEELTSCFKTDKRNLTNLTRALESLKNLQFNGLLGTKVYNVWAKTVQRSHLSLHWRVDAKFEEKLSCGLKNDMRNLSNLYQSTRKSENWDFDGIFLSKVENVWA